MIDLRLGDCIEVLKTIPDNSVDSVVCDPPYGLSFMNKKWDYDVPSVDVWKECLRVLKPGGHLLAFGGSRTYHRLAVAVEDAGFEIRDQIMWVYGSGFPKSHNIGKAIDKIQGNEREVIGSRTHRNSDGSNDGYKRPCDEDRIKNGVPITKGNSDWEGWGTALKPAHEPIVMARKPLSEKSVAENVLKWGTGGINIDGCRIGNEIMVNQPAGDNDVYNTTWKGSKTEPTITEGRFPANIMFDEEAGKLLDQQSGTLKSGYVASHHKTKDSSWYGASGQYSNNSTQKNDLVGGASRFFYCPKVSKKERDMGLTGEEKMAHLVNNRKEDSAGMVRREGESGTNPYLSVSSNRKNTHPTVKPIKLMEYLITLITQKGGVVLDCFMGSGSTGIAARNKGFSFIGIEKEQEYMDIAKQRINSSYQTKMDI